MNSIIPISRIPIDIRPATMSDLPFIDSLQKQQAKNVGWMPTKQLESKIAAGNVLVAEATSKDEFRRMKDEDGGTSDDVRCPHDSSFSLHPSSFVSLGYLIARDQYFKRDDIGIIYQINVVPGNQRALIGAALLKAQFERSAYGCRLYCCWCAQDIEANRFWEAMGFVPLAFRAGSQKRGRVHIFWQKRIRQGDCHTPWWFPSQTSGGSIRENRIVLPIPPGAHWSDEMPRILPGEAQPTRNKPALPPPASDRPAPARPAKPAAAKQPDRSIYSVARSKLHFEAPRPAKKAPEPDKKAPQPGGNAPHEKAPARETRPPRRNDPAIVAAARELRDRWLERVNADPSALIAQAKYELTRQLPANPLPALAA